MQDGLDVVQWCRLFLLPCLTVVCSILLPHTNTESTAFSWFTVCTRLFSCLLLLLQTRIQMRLMQRNFWRSTTAQQRWCGMPTQRLPGSTTLTSTKPISRQWWEPLTDSDEVTVIKDCCIFFFCELTTDWITEMKISPWIHISSMHLWPSLCSSSHPCNHLPIRSVCLHW